MSTLGAWSVSPAMPQFMKEADMRTQNAGSAGKQRFHLWLNAWLARLAAFGKHYLSIHEY